MNTFQRLMHCDGRTDRLTYQRNVALLALGKSAVDLLTITFLPGTEPSLVALSWINPFALVQPLTAGLMPFVVCLGAFLFFVGLVWNSVHRMRDMGWSHWLGLLTAVPFINLPAAMVLCIVPPKRRKVWDLCEP